MTAKRKTGTTHRIGPLKTAIDCRFELAKTYRQYRRGEIDDRMAKTSTYILNVLMGIISEHDIERRLEQLEEQVNT